VALQAIRKKAGSPARISHASCRMNLYIVHVVVVGRNLEKRSDLLLSLLSGRRRRRRSGAVSSDQGQTVPFGRLRLVFVELNISVGAERALADELSLFPHDVFDRDARV
jgi:hypothetical protein